MLIGIIIESKDKIVPFYVYLLSLFTKNVTYFYTFVRTVSDNRVEKLKR